jgi:MFS transporter, putative metabolite:H+ symporter
MNTLNLSNQSIKQSSIFFLLAIASLGYFVDAYDLLIFSVVRRESIIDLGLATGDTQIKSIGISLENWQSLGLMIGGITWGVFGDKIGRMKMLYGSIACYSIANLLNGFLNPAWGNVFNWYSALRLFSGLGLAGELGVGITLVSEAMQTTKRGLGTMVIAAVGFLGAITAAWLGSLGSIKWNTLFIIGGVAGILLLFLRIGIYESRLFLIQKESQIKKGAFLSLFTNGKRFRKYILCILVGLPVYFVIGLPIKFASNFGQAFNIKGVTVSTAIITCYLFVALGDIFCNYLSQLLRSRKIPLLLFNSINLIAVLLFIFLPPKTVWQYEFIYCPLLGFSVGYWALIVTNAAEQFGTNLRATVATTVPNFIRSTFIPIALLFTTLENLMNTITSAAIIGIACSVIGIFSAIFLKESFNKDLDYSE